jgi:hypothetical protein
MEAMGHRLAHVVHAFDEVFVQAMIDPMIMNAVDAVVVVLIGLAPGDDMEIVPPPLQTGGQFRDVDSQSSRRNGMQRFRGKHGDTHFLPPVAPCGRRLF